MAATDGGISTFRESVTSISLVAEDSRLDEVPLSEGVRQMYGFGVCTVDKTKDGPIKKGSIVAPYGTANKSLGTLEFHPDLGILQPDNLKDDYEKYIFGSRIGKRRTIENLFVVANPNILLRVAHNRSTVATMSPVPTQTQIEIIQKIMVKNRFEDLIYMYTKDQSADDLKGIVEAFDESTVSIRFSSFEKLFS